MFFAIVEQESWWYFVNLFKILLNYFRTLFAFGILRGHGCCFVLIKITVLHCKVEDNNCYNVSNNMVTNMYVLVLMFVL